MSLLEALSTAIGGSRVISFFTRFFGAESSDDSGINDQASTLYEHLPDVMDSRSDVSDAIDGLSFEHEAEREGIINPTIKEEKNVSFD